MYNYGFSPSGIAGFRYMFYVLVFYSSTLRIKFGITAILRSSTTEDKPKKPQ
jgi:hypothetical protein